MIQLNLLPDIKLEYIRAQRQRRLIFSISAISTAVALAILISLLLVSGLQKKHLSDLNRDITNQSNTLSDKKDITKILTVQNQLSSLTNLHDTKPAAARLFDFLNQVTPVVVSISDMTIDFNAKTITLTGSSTALSSVNQYVDTLKFTTYTPEANGTAVKAFSDVVLSSYSLASGAQAGTSPASYSISLNYDPGLFDNTNHATLRVPATVSTRSNLNNSDLFQAQPAGAVTNKSN